jgi:hypothetical protein
MISSKRTNVHETIYKCNIGSIKAYTNLTKKHKSLNEALLSNLSSDSSLISVSGSPQTSLTDRCCWN